MHIFTTRTIAAALIMLAVPVGLPSAATAAGIGHTFIMRGSVVDVTDGKPTICVGKADGAKVGQTLDVIRMTSLPGTRGYSGFRRENIGQIRISAIVDDHFATATIVKGDVEKHDIVELRKN
jgi:methyl coenzyme M reductase beta subunit